MKFGKQLAKVVALSDPEWAPYWVSYKALKKRVKELTDSPPPGTQPKDTQPPTAAPPSNTEPNPKDLAQSAGEVAFFRTLRAEVAKASEFYLGMEQQMGARRRRIKVGIQYLKQPTTVLEDDAWIKMRRACISLYKDLLLLENFAVMNYCGTYLGPCSSWSTFGLRLLSLSPLLSLSHVSHHRVLPSRNPTACSKALKKHDKTVVLDTRSRFMRNVVNQQPFTHYPRLLEMLQEMEETFKEIDALQGESARPLEDEERLFLEAIRGLNQEASSMQREEKADLGALSTSDPEHSADDQCSTSNQDATAPAPGKRSASAADAAAKKVAAAATTGGGGGPNQVLAAKDGDAALAQRADEDEGSAGKRRRV